jgi:hypothetical protein
MTEAEIEPARPILSMSWCSSSSSRKFSKIDRIGRAGSISASVMIVSLEFIIKKSRDITALSKKMYACTSHCKEEHH